MTVASQGNQGYETRVGLVPAESGVARIRHRVLSKRKPASASSIPDKEYIDAGAEIRATAAEVWSQADLVSSQGAQPSEYAHFRTG